jgi:bacteriocin biosynthesis cyclodehydratase domain-containing protein
MASAIRVTSAPLKKVALLALGPFGARVISLLADGHPGYCDYQLTCAQIPAAFTSGASAVVMALWRPDPGLCEVADDLAFRYRVPWLPIVMEHPVIRIGPVVSPAAGPCFRCYARRRNQHDLQTWVTAALQAVYTREPASGPAGYLPHHARLAAAVAIDLLGRLNAETAPADPGQVAGEVTTIRLADGGLAVNRVVACNNCHRCDGAGPYAAPDWLAELAHSRDDGRARR